MKTPELQTLRCHLAGAAFALLLLLTGANRLVAGSLKVGDAFPDLTQYQLAGKLPDNLKGKVILVDFWASWCVPCKESFPALNDLHKRFGEKGLAIVGVSVDEKSAEMERFLKKTKADFTVVRDATQKLVAAADAAAMPTSFLIDKQGKVRFIHNGYFGDSTKKEYEREIQELLKAP